MSMPLDISKHPHSGNGGARADSYFTSMHESIEAIACRTENPEKTRKRLLQKLNPTATTLPDFRQYLQHACETSVVAYLARVLEGDFSYEPRTQGAKNVDGSLTWGEFTFKVEVKCPDPKPRPVNKETEPTTIVRTHGRIDSPSVLMNDIGRLISAMGSDKASYVSNSDLKIKDCLLESAKKFGSVSNHQELNCVVICCGSPDDIQHYYHCLFGSQGLFTEQSFCPNCEYDSVDTVVLTNVLHRHEQYYAAEAVDDPWLFESAFNIVFENPRRGIEKMAALRRFGSLIPNFGRQLNEFVVPGENPVSITDPVKLLYFIQDELPKCGPTIFFRTSVV